MDKYRSLSIGEPSIPWNQEWSPDGWNDWRFLRHVKHKGYTLRARVDDFNVFPSSFIYHMSWKYTFKKKIFQIFKQMGETQHCVLKVIIIFFFLKCSYFYKNSWRNASGGFLLWQNFSGKYQNLKLKVYSWTSVCVELTRTYVCDMMETHRHRCLWYTAERKKVYSVKILCVSVYDYACGSLCPECCQSSSLLLTLLGCRVFWHKAYTTLIMKNVFKF